MAKGGGDGGDGTGETGAQDKMRLKGEITQLQDAGYDPHDLKPKFNGSKFDLYKTPEGDVVVKPNGGAGRGVPTAVNLNDL